MPPRVADLEVRVARPANSGAAVRPVTRVLRVARLPGPLPGVDPPARTLGAPGPVGAETDTAGPDAPRAQYSPLMTKYDPRMVPASFDFWRANLNEANSGGTSMPSDSLNPTARFGLGPSRVYRTLIDSPLS